ncbi:MAG: protein kinase domain-containing protein, partial [Planctomycetota bacterium]
MLGTNLGPYHLLTEIGSGGMGKVYLAEVTQKTARLEKGAHAALKVIHPHLLAREGFFKRFMREAEVGKRVEHENVVRTYDCDALAVGGQQQHFLVMEYVDGQTLRGLIEELERLPEELCRHVGREVARGLAAIHEAGAVHRDLKPENVLITPHHVVKIMDLGVAHLQDEVIRLSRAGEFVGSIEYAAPEQIQSQGNGVDGRADLHALGVLLYELSTGQNPYRDEEAGKVLRKVLEEKPRRAGEVNPQLSPFFEEVVETLLKKDREERFPTASVLADVLDEGERSTWWQKRARALRVETRRPLRRVRIPRETALYGREEELDRLRMLYGRAKRGEGQVVLIEGEAGIGKTRLVDELVGHLRQDGEDVNFLFGAYPPGGAATASGAFSTAYREQFGSEGLDETLAEYVRETPLLIPAFAALLRGDATPTGAEPLTKDSLQTVFVHATRALAAERPTVVLIDDLQFAPEAGLALFASLALALPGHRVLLIGASRPGLSDDWRANLERQDHASRLELRRLGPKDLVALLREAFRSERLADELAGRIAVKSDGNPYFAFEIIRGLREGQFIAQQADGTWVSTQVIQNIQIPSSVMDLIRARLRDLSDEERDLLDVASCCGFDFDPLLVGRLVGMADIPVLKRLGRIEQKHRLVRTSGRRYVFDHHQVQEALYEGLSELLRERYHAAIGDALVAREGLSEPGTHPSDGALYVTVCDHFLLGHRGEDALRYLDGALGHLEEGYLNDQAIALANRALAVPGLLAGERRIDVLLRKNERLDLLGRRTEQSQTLGEMRSLAEAAGSRSALAEAERGMGMLAYRTGHAETAMGHFERQLQIAREIGDRRQEARALGRLGVVLRSQGKNDEARDHHEEARVIAREICDPLHEARATGNLGIVAYTEGAYAEARKYYES